MNFKNVDKNTHSSCPQAIARTINTNPSAFDA